MVPDIASKGHSFKGAMAYYLHDKRQDAASPQPVTAERVAWTETRNLAVDDPRAATHIMVATAKSADQLKAAAGVSNAGRKSNAHVYAYSLAWHPDEAGQLDRAEMIRAADQSLKALKADHLQAVFVCHQDQKHPHVHVILNRVDPATGKMHGFSKDREILSEWANQYERERGQILTPKREEKRILQETFAKSAEPVPQPRKDVQERPQPVKVDKSPAAMLKELGDAQKARHKLEWAELGDRSKAARDEVYSAYGQQIKEAATRHKAETKAIWAAHFKEARTAERGFAAREKTLGGIIRNALDATTHQQITGQAGDRGKLSMVFGNVLSSQQRQAAFAARQDMSRQQLAQRLKSVLDSEIATLKNDRAAGLVAQRVAFGDARAQLIDRQNVESAKVREAWRQIYADRGKDPAYERRSATAARIEQQQKWKAQRAEKKATMRDNAKAPTYRRDVALSPVQQARGIERKERLRPSTENPTMKDQFDKARQIEQRPKLAPATKPALVSHPAPAPAPAGETPRPAPKTVQQVPKAPAPAASVKPPAPRQDFAAKSGGNAVAATPPAKKDWGALTAPASPANSTPAAPKKDWTKAVTAAPKDDSNNPTRTGPRRS